MVHYIDKKNRRGIRGNCCLGWQNEFKLGHFEFEAFMKLSTTNWHLPSTSARIKSGATAAADLQHPLKGIQSGDQE